MARIVKQDYEVFVKHKHDSNGSFVFIKLNILGEKTAAPQGPLLDPLYVTRMTRTSI